MMRQILALACAGVVSAVTASWSAAAISPPAPEVILTVQETSNGTTTVYNSFGITVWWGMTPVEVGGTSTLMQQWIYTVVDLQVGGKKALSHFFLDLCGAALDDVASISAPGRKDHNGTIPAKPDGILWEPLSESEKTFVFSFFLEVPHAPTEVQTSASTKAGNTYALGNVVGPSCQLTPVPLPSAVLMGTVVLSGIIGGRAMRRKSA